MNGSNWTLVTQEPNVVQPSKKHMEDDSRVWVVTLTWMDDHNKYGYRPHARPPAANTYANDARLLGNSGLL